MRTTSTTRPASSYSVVVWATTSRGKPPVRPKVCQRCSPSPRDPVSRHVADRELGRRPRSSHRAFAGSSGSCSHPIRNGSSPRQNCSYFSVVFKAAASRDRPFDATNDQIANKQVEDGAGNGDQAKSSCPQGLSRASAPTIHPWRGPLGVTRGRMVSWESSSRCGTSRATDMTVRLGLARRR